MASRSTPKPQEVDEARAERSRDREGDVRPDGKPPSPPCPPAAGSARVRVAEKLLPKFIGHRRQDVSTVRLALERRDFETISRIGHNMRGNGVSYGFPEIGVLGEQLERAANTTNVQGVREQLTLLEAWVARIGEHPIPGAESQDAEAARKKA
jgi:HPt (histidine-containing phosphotransfer) domain-containing protein